MRKNKKGKIEMFYQDKVVNRDDLFRLAVNIYYTAKSHYNNAKYAIANNDYVAYGQAKNNFEDMLRMIQNPVFAEWKYAKDLEDLHIPEYTVQDWIEATLTTFEVMCEETAVTVEDDCDVPF